MAQQAARRHEELTDDLDQPVSSRPSADAHAGHLLDRIFEPLSDRQAVILRALLAGQTCAESARLLQCSTANIAWHMRKIRQVYHDLTGQAGGKQRGPGASF